MFAGTNDRPSVAGQNVAVVNWRDPWHPEAGGAEQFAWQMAVGLRDRGAGVWYVTARAPGQARREIRDAIHIIRIGSRLTVYPGILAWIARHRRAFHAVVDCQNGIPFFTPWVLPRRVPVFCVIHHVHDVQFGVHFPPVVANFGRFLEGPVARWTYRRHEYIAVSQSTVDAIRHRLRWTGPVHVIPNGLAADCYVRAERSDGVAVADPPDTVTLTWVGRLVAHKRPERVLDIAAGLGEVPAVIDVIGRGPAATELAHQVAARGLTGRVRLRGYLSEADKRAAVAGSLLHINTSMGEGWGLCVLEAAALGVPTVAYDVDGLRDAVRDGETGWLVRASDGIEDVVRRAISELADPARRAEMAVACRRWAQQFDWDRSAGLLADLIAAAAPQAGTNPKTRGPAVGTAHD